MLIDSLALDYELALRGILIGMEFYSHCIKASDVVYRLKTQLSLAVMMNKIQLMKCD